MKWQSKWGYFAVTMTISIVLISLFGFTRKDTNSFDFDGLINVAHRGASAYAPENTMSAFKKGVAQGVDYIECDVHLSKDGKLIIIHDEKLNRTTNGSGKVSNFTLEQLKKLDAGAKFHKSYVGEQLITLDELLDEFHNQVGIIIEIKNPKKYPGIEEKVAELVKEYRVANIMIQSTDFDSMRIMYELVPHIPIAVLVSHTQHPLSTEQLDELSEFVTYFNYNIKYLSEKVVSEIKKRNKQILAWTIKDKRTMSKAVHLGVDGIITDYSDWLSRSNE